MGKYGVYLFFVLSAFLLTKQFLDANRDEALSLNFLRHYFIRRVLRIYPLFLFALLAYYLFGVIYGVVIYDNLDGFMILKSLALLDAEGIFWTIPVEFQYYFLLPIVAALYIALMHRPMLAAVMSVVFIVVWGWFFSPEFTNTVIPFLPMFVCGSFAAYAQKRIEARRRDDSAKYFIWSNSLALACFLAFFALAPYFVIGVFHIEVERTFAHREFLLFGALSSLLILAVINGNGIVKKMMESSAFTFMGKISFSAYLFHMIFLPIVVLFHTGGKEWKLLLFMAYTISFSTLTYMLVERPLSKVHTFKRLFSKARSVVIR